MLGKKQTAHAPQAGMDLPRVGLFPQGTRVESCKITDFEMRPTGNLIPTPSVTSWGPWASHFTSLNLIFFIGGMFLHYLPHRAL